MLTSGDCSDSDFLPSSSMSKGLLRAAQGQALVNSACFARMGAAGLQPLHAGEPTCNARHQQQQQQQQQQQPPQQQQQPDPPSKAVK
jgi:hypothetical protein